MQKNLVCLCMNGSSGMLLEKQVQDPLKDGHGIKLSVSVAGTNGRHGVTKLSKGRNRPLLM